MKSKLSKIVIFVFFVANLGIADYVKRDNAVYYKAETEQANEKKVDNAYDKLPVHHCYLY